MQVFKMHFTDFRRFLGPALQSKPGQASEPHDHQNMHAHPDQEQMEEAINVFLSHMEQQEKGDFKDLHSILLKLPMPTAAPMLS